ncbi:MAG: tetratricopeptide repeat protein [bacterium]
MFADKIVETVRHTIAYFYVFEGDQDYKKFEKTDKENANSMQDEVVDDTTDDENSLQSALENYQKALDLYPEHVKARYNLGNIYVAYESYETAADYYEEALKTAPDFFNARINLGIVLDRKLKDIDEGIEQYQKVVDSKLSIIKIPFIYNNEYHVLHSKAIAYYNMGLAYRDKAILMGLNGTSAQIFLQRAAESYKNSIKIEPNVYESHYNYAIALQLLGRKQQATEEYCKAINLSPLNYEAHYNLAILLNDEGKYQESADALSKAGVILDIHGEEGKSKYVYSFLNEVSQRIVIKNENLSPNSPRVKYVPNKDLIEYQNDLILKNSGWKVKPLWQKDQDDYPWLIHENGKVKFDDKMEKAMLENMKTCNACKIVKLKHRDKD